MHAKRHQILLSTAALMGALTGYSRSAYAQQVCLQQGGTATFLCDGSSGDTQDLTFATTGVNNANVITDLNFDVDTVAGTGGNAITITGDGALSYTDENASSLTAADTALFVSSTADDGGTPGSVTVTTGGVLSGGADGLEARNYGSGSTSVTANGNVTGDTGFGIYAANGTNQTPAGTDLTVTTGTGTVTGGADGIRASNFGVGVTTVEINGNVYGANRSGLQVQGAYASAYVTTAAGTTVQGFENGITSGGASSARTVVVNGEVTGETLDGINLEITTGDADIVINTGADSTVNGFVSGINARSYTTGAVNITVNGDVTGAEGIFSYHYGGGAINVTVGASSTVTSNGGDGGDFAVDTYYGPTTLTVAGTLNGGGGGAVRFDQSNAINDRLELHPTAAINGDVFAGLGTDTLAFGGSGDGAFNLTNIDTGANTEQYQDFETFQVENGTWNFSGATTVPFTVTGGTVKGNGTFGDLTFNGGTLSPGNSIGTTTVNGVFSLNTGAIYEVEVNAAGQGDKVIVNGTVNLTGATLRVLAEDGDYKTKTDYVIIENDDTDAVNGVFATVTSNLAFLIPTVIYDGGTGNDVVLTLERVFGPDGSPLSFCSVAKTKNQCSVGMALDRFPTNNALFLAVLNQTASGARQAFDALSGEIHATAAGVLADDNRYVREAVLGRLMQAGHTSGGAAQMALAAGGPQVASLDSQAMALGYGYDGKSLVAPERQPLAFWTRAYGAWGDYDTDGNAATANRDLGGFMSGMDASIGGSWRAGLTTGASYSSVDVDARFSSADIESYYLGGYLGGTAGAFALRGGGTWAWSDIDTSRAVVFPGFFERQKASYHGDTGQIFGEVAYPTLFGGVAVEPFGGIAFVSLDTDAFRERGGPLASLRGRNTDQDVGYTTVGLRAATTMYWGAIQVVPHISAAWQHAFDDVTPSAALAFASTGIGFSIDGVPLAEDSALLDVGLDFALGPNTTAGVSYSGQFADNVTDNAVKGRFTWLF